MTTFDYARLRDGTAERLLRRFGKTVTLQKRNANGANPWDGETDGSSFSVTALEKSFSVMERDGTLVQDGDKRYIVSTEGDPEPEMSDRLIDGSQTFQIVGVDRLAPGPTTMLWYVHCRR